MAQAISGMLPNLRLKLPGCPEPLIKETLYEKLREFFWESEVWRYTSNNGLDYTISQQAMNLPVAGTDMPADTVIKRVDTVKYSSTGANWDTKIPFLTRDQLDRANSDWESETGSSPSAWTYDGATPIIYPIATATVATSLLLRVIIAPNFSEVTSTLPDLLYFEYKKYIEDGVIADLKEMPGKDWSDPVNARFYTDRWQDGIDKAKSRGNADFGQPDRTMAYGGI